MKANKNAEKVRERERKARREAIFRNSADNGGREGYTSKKGEVLEKGNAIQKEGDERVGRSMWFSTVDLLEKGKKDEKDRKLWGTEKSRDVSSFLEARGQR